MGIMLFSVLLNSPIKDNRIPTPVKMNIMLFPITLPYIGFTKTIKKQVIPIMREK